MDFTTKIPISKTNYPMIDYASKIVLLGSCFSDNIGKKLEFFKLQNLQNPFGILFHPIAIKTLIENAINKKKYSGKDVFFHNELWHCFDAHSELSSSYIEDLLVELNSQIQLTNKQIHESTHIIITLGTSWVYRNKETQQIVANCHKVPQKQFIKELLSVDDITKSLETIINLIRSVNPKASVIFTVSPVRHIKDGFVESTQSKAHLITAIHKIVNEDSKIFYFPSYEIMMDELRDYRFYAEDMLHPNQTAINYIWEKFQLAWVSEDSYKTMEEVDAVQKGLQHKPFNPNSEAHQKFLKDLEIKKLELQKKFDYIIF